MKENLAGVNSIWEALNGRRKIEKILIQEGRQGKRIEDLVNLAYHKGVLVQVVNKSKLDKIYSTGNHQGVIAVAGPYPYSTLEEVMDIAAAKNEAPFIVMLDGIEDPRNMGAIIRTADAGGVHGIVIPRHNSVRINEVVSRASAGAIEYMHIVQEANLVNTIKRLKEKGMWIVGADMNTANNYFSTTIPAPTVLIIGGEGKGIRRLVKENCDILLKIPMYGNISSLNASVAGALLIYEVKRQRLNGAKG